ncbi:hypothetical protein [Actinoplanes subtropicus]|uniref:hypothetical protein n=1 Tax=Actinoplanes subtropicus TaxID=543632 RepID=UPI000690AA39|nr:hypothetical protein [Actinoplanes subtropicus]
MSTNTKKLLIVAAMVLGAMAGCGHLGDKSSDDDNFQKALAYAKCMRANGAPDYPDPQRKDGGVEVSTPKDVDQRALTACRDKNPQNDIGAGGGTVDSAKLADWTKCMRGKLPDLPDPEVTGNTITLQLTGTGINGGSADFRNAQKACESHFPGGNLRSVNNP